MVESSSLSTSRDRGRLGQGVRRRARGPGRPWSLKNPDRILPGKKTRENDKLKNQNKKAKKVQIWAYGAMNIGLEKRVGKRIFSEIDAFSFGHFLVILMAFANISVNFLHIWIIF